jgi:dihydrofolate reductase
VHDTPPPAAPPSEPKAPAAHRVALIAAIARNRIIGADNRLPWRLPEDMKRFRALTTGHAVIMGRRTWESIGKALPGRQNIVVTRDASRGARDVEFVPSLDAALACVSLPNPVFVIGGQALYREALPRAELMYLTEIERDFPGDARFPDFDRAQWRELTRVTRAAALDEPDAFTYHFVVYERADSG